MEKLIKVHRDNDQLDFKAIWKEGLFVFDSNVLLDLYRLPNSAQKDLIRILKNDDFNKRVWIGFQVILEFLNNRFEAISDQKNKFNSVRKILEDALEQHEGVISTLKVELNKLKLKQRHSSIDPDKFINDKNINNGVKYLNDFIDNLEKLEGKQSDVNDQDKIKDIVLEIFKDKVGKGFDKKRLSEIYKEGDKRYDNKVPPGFKDIKKPGAHLYEDKEYIRKYGDLLLWFEIIEKASEKEFKYIVLVTGDVKEDWWFEKRGRKLGPRLELLNEIYSKVPDLDTFYLYDTSTFLQYAKKELDNRIKDSSINEAKELIELSKENRNESVEGLLNIHDFLRKIGSRVDGLKMGIGKSVKNLPLLNINVRPFYIALIEILTNVVEHSTNGYVGIQADENESLIRLRFKNLKPDLPDSEEESSNFRGKGIEYAASILSKEMIDSRIYDQGKRFVFEIFIPKNTMPNNVYKT